MSAGNGVGKGAGKGAGNGAENGTRKGAGSNGDGGAGKGATQGSKQQPFRFKGLKLLGFVVLLYGGAYLWDASRAFKSLEGFAHILGTLIPILIVVTVLTALINRFIDPKSLARHLGEESGVKRWIIALSAGVVSHGPMYAWYPMIQGLREKGARDGLLIAFFYARAVKVALLPMMVAYFGLTFTVVLTLLTLLAAWGQGVVMDRVSGSRKERE